MNNINSNNCNKSSNPMGAINTDSVSDYNDNDHSNNNDIRHLIM